MKPYPVPDLTGQAAKDFEEAIKNGPTKGQKELIKEAAGTVAKSKSKRKK